MATALCVLLTAGLLNAADQPVGPADSHFADDAELYDPFAGPTDNATVDLPDPLRGYNYCAYLFNDTLFIYGLRPVAIGWSYAIYPEPCRRSIDRFFLNLEFPKRFVNCLLQGKGAASGVELSRFLINTTLGLAGLFDPARAWFDMKPHFEDMGQTFATWGMGSGFYFVIPVLGPSCGRDTLGLPFDLILNPTIFLHRWIALALAAGDTINHTSLDPDEYLELKAMAIDPYVGIRSAYAQYRENAIAR